ncbi:MAG: SprT family zinc-dependent metalloprotease [Dehalococcoidales bacterium]|nr:SprT family zinc-dependent metalloprotease [Dehalococcoidales bacterium]
MIRKTRPRLAILGTREVIIDGQAIPYIIKRSVRARSVRLEVRPETGLIVVIPRFYRPEQIPDLLREKLRWVSANLKKYERIKRLTGSKVLQGGDTVPYLGREMEVVTRPSNGNGDSVNVEENRLVVSLNAESNRLGQALEQWYRVRVAQLISEKAERLSADMGLTYGRLSIRGQKTCWGSCSRKGNISLNWKLIMAPEAVIDYVIIHELAHLKELNHSRMFWQLVSKYCPEWRQHKKWLKEHAFELTAQIP